MPLSKGSSQRSLIHNRTVTFEGYRRGDGLYDIEARVIDVKPLDMQLASGARPAGEPVHEMRLRLTVDARLNVLAAEASSDAVPYPDFCETVAPDYRRLVGRNLASGFGKVVRELFGGVNGCTHLNELLLQFPTAAVQTLAGERRDTDDSQGKPFQLDRCHALDTRGQGVKRYYPRWYRGEKTGTD